MYHASSGMVKHIRVVSSPLASNMAGTYGQPGPTHGPTHHIRHFCIITGLLSYILIVGSHQKLSPGHPHMGMSRNS